MERLGYWKMPALSFWSSNIGPNPPPPPPTSADTETIPSPFHLTTKYLHMQNTELCLASSKILTPTPPHPLSTQRVCPPPAPKEGGGTHQPGSEGGGGSIFWKTTDIGLVSYSIISLRISLPPFLQRQGVEKYDTRKAYYSSFLLFHEGGTDRVSLTSPPFLCRASQYSPAVSRGIFGRLRPPPHPQAGLFLPERNRKTR